MLAHCDFEQNRSQEKRGVFTKLKLSQGFRNAILPCMVRMDYTPKGDLNDLTSHEMAKSLVNAGAPDDAEWFCHLMGYKDVDLEVLDSGTVIHYTAILKPTGS